jgi:hypothetical protein
MGKPVADEDAKDRVVTPGTPQVYDIPNFVVIHWEAGLGEYKGYVLTFFF